MLTFQEYQFFLLKLLKNEFLIQNRSFFCLNFTKNDFLKQKLHIQACTMLRKQQKGNQKPGKYSSEEIASNRAE